MDVARTGSAARTQDLGTYTPGTRTYTGTKSRVTFTITPEPGKSVILGEYVLIVTPLVGSPYTLRVAREYEVTYPTTTVVLNYPWVVSAGIYLDRWKFTHTIGSKDDFETATTGEVFSLPPSAGWNAPATLPCPAPCSDFSDDFSSVPDGVTVVTTVVSGRFWDQPGTFVSGNYDDSYDGFEDGIDGEVEVLSGGVGWDSLGYMLVYNFSSAYDTFEGYTDGTVSGNLTLGTGWSGDGYLI